MALGFLKGMRNNKLLLILSVIALCYGTYLLSGFINEVNLKNKNSSMVATIENLEDINREYVKNFNLTFNNYQYISSPTILDLFNEQKQKLNNLIRLKDKYGKYKHLQLTTQAYIDYINNQKDLAIINAENALESISLLLKNISKKGKKISPSFKRVLASEAATILNLIALIERDNHNYVNSLKIYSLALHSNPTDAGIIGNRGFLISAIFRDHALALRDHNFAVELSKSNSKALYAKAFILHLQAIDSKNLSNTEQSKKINEAIRIYKQSIDSASSKGEKDIYYIYKALAHVSLANILDNQSETKKALYDLHKSVSKIDSKDGNYFLGYLLANAGEFLAANKYLEKSLSLFPKDSKEASIVKTAIKMCENKNRNYFNTNQKVISEDYHNSGQFRIDWCSQPKAIKLKIEEILKQEPEDLFSSLAPNTKSTVSDLFRLLSVSHSENLVS